MNRLKVFDIDSREEFTLLIGQHGKPQKTPRFVHALTDPNALDVVAHNLEVKNLSHIKSGPKPAEITRETIRNYFSKDILSIPAITDPRQIEIAIALHKASGPVVYLDELERKEIAVVKMGIHQTAGPKKGLSEYTEKIPPEELPKWEDVLAGKIGKWVPLYRGRNFDLMDPCTSQEAPDILRWSRYEKCTLEGFDPNSYRVFWRRISQTSNQRTLIATLAPPGTWSDDTIYIFQIPIRRQAAAIAFIFCFFGIDFLVRSVGSTMTKGIICGLPIPNYHTSALEEAISLCSGFLNMTERDETKRRIARAKADALGWIHFGFGKHPLDRDGLEWLLSTQFDCLNRHDPEYKNLVLAAYDEYIKDPKMTSRPTGLIFNMTKK